MCKRKGFIRLSGVAARGFVIARGCWDGRDGGGGCVLTQDNPSTVRPYLQGDSRS